MTARSNTVLVRELLSRDGPHLRVADDFVRSMCAGCGDALVHDPRYGEWGAFCAECWPKERAPSVGVAGLTSAAS